MSFEISCLCGDTKVAIDGEPVGQFYCHCDDCQAVFGAAYIGVSLYPKDTVRVTQGNPASWKYKTNTRYRCPQCGTFLFSDPPRAPFYGVKANLLPEGVFKPTAHIQCQYAVLPVVDDLPHYKAFPAAVGGSDEQVHW